MTWRWNTYSDYLKKRYGAPVFRIGVDGGFSCPNRRPDRGGGCAFCDGTGAVAVYQRKDESGFHHDSEFNDKVSERIIGRCASIGEQIEKGKKFLKTRYKADDYSIYFQSFTNTFDTVANLEKVYDAVLPYGPFKEFIVSTRPDCLDEEKVRLLTKYRDMGMDVWVELGLQTANDRTLEAINRGHDSACYLRAAELVKREGLFLSTHVIIGLPGEGREDYIRTAECVNSAHSDAIKLHNLNVAGGTKLADDYEKGLFKVYSAAEYMKEAAEVLRRLRPDMVIQRLMSETPSHRLIAPRDFPDKSKFLSMLNGYMEMNDIEQGELFHET